MVEEAAHDGIQSHAPPSFFERVGQVFGNLGGALKRTLDAHNAYQRTPDPSETAAWSLQREQVCRAGSTHRASSDEEDAGVSQTATLRPVVAPPPHTAAVDAFQARLVDEQVLEHAELRDAHGMQPTLAFCQVCHTAVIKPSLMHHQQALDHEDDYDEVDAIATDTYQSRASGASLRKDLEVLDDSVYEQRLLHSSCTAQQPTQIPNLPRPTGKRTRQGTSTPATNVVPQRQAHQVRNQTRAGSVPDHVRNPHKYTCYPLDAPVLVGSGVVPGDSGGTTDVLRVGGQQSPGGAPQGPPFERKEGGATQEPRFEPVSGSGVVAFRATRSGGGGGGSSARHRATIEMEPEDGDGNGDGVAGQEAMEAVPATTHFRAAGQPKQRQLRKPQPNE